MCGRNVDLVFVVPKMEATNYTESIVSGIYKRLIVGPNATRVGVVSYGAVGLFRVVNQVKVAFQLNAYPNETQVIQAMRDGFDTQVAIDDAIEVMRTRVFTQSGDRDGVRNIAVVLAYRTTVRYYDHSFTPVELAKRDGITILAIGTKSLRNQLRSISSSVRGKRYYWFFDRGGDERFVNEVVEIINKLTCKVVT